MKCILFFGITCYNSGMFNLEIEKKKLLVCFQIFVLFFGKNVIFKNGINWPSLAEVSLINATILISSQTYFFRFEEPPMRQFLLTLSASS